MRGKLGDAVCHGEFLRIIPARAGQTKRSRTPPCRHPDHPRACGANYKQGELKALPAGSSPRVRGKRSGYARPHGSSRIIPARAGQTSTDSRRRTRTQDHPRACGANDPDAEYLGADNGSSPRVRGKLPAPTKISSSCRIIPARAGQTRR